MEGSSKLVAALSPHRFILSVVECMQRKMLYFVVILHHPGTCNIKHSIK